MTITCDLQGLHHNSEEESNWACQGRGAEPTHKLTFQHLYLRATFLVLYSLKIDTLLKKKGKSVVLVIDVKRPKLLMLEKTI